MAVARQRAVCRYHMVRMEMMNHPVSRVGAFGNAANLVHRYGVSLELRSSQATWHYYRYHQADAFNYVWFRL